MNKARGFDTFDLYCVHIMSLLVRQDSDSELVSDVVEHLRHLKLEHYGLLEKIRIIEEKANVDVKTGLYKYNDNYLENIIKIASRALDGKDDEVYEVSYIRMDIDNFSRLNNMYGHDLGDRVLHNLAMIVRETTRPTDWPIRFGGEEFDVMLPSTNLKGATRVMDKIMKKIRASTLHHQKVNIKITVSAGISLFQIPVKKLRSIQRRETVRCYLKMQKEADDALYESKADGKNQYNVYDLRKKSEYPKIRKKYVASTHR